MILSKHQEIVMDIFRQKGICTISDLQGIYTNHAALSSCLKRLVVLKKIRIIDYGKFEVIE